MNRMRISLPLPFAIAALTVGAVLLTVAAAVAGDDPQEQQDQLERQTGAASYYGPQFAGRPMADGTPFEPESNFAASRTLPLGTWVRVTNLENGKSEIVQIRDRGPYIDGRIIDLSPQTARKLDMIEQGVVEVEVVTLSEEDQRQLAQTEAPQTSGK